MSSQLKNKCQSWERSLRGSVPGANFLAVAYKIKWGRWPTDEIRLGVCDMTLWYLHQHFKNAEKACCNASTSRSSIRKFRDRYVRMSAWVFGFIIFSRDCCFSFQTSQEWTLPWLVVCLFAFFLFFGGFFFFWYCFCCCCFISFFLFRIAYFYLVSFAVPHEMWALLWWGIEPEPPALGAWSLNHWTAREVPR